MNKCPSCSNKNKKNAEFCEFCGYDLIGKTRVEGSSRLSDEEFMALINKNFSKWMLFGYPGLFFVLVFFISIAFLDGDNVTANQVIWLVIIFVAAMVCLGIGSYYQNKARKIFKINILQDALAELFTDLHYKQDGHIEPERIREAGLIDDWNSFEGNDYISGTYRGRIIEISDIVLKRTGSGKNKSSTTLFRGQWMTCKMDKEIPAKLRVRENGARGNVTTENEAFNKQFQILADDPHYAFYVLTPHFMEFIVAADLAANGKTYYYFSGDTAHVAIHNYHDSFEIPVDKQARSDLSLIRENIKKEMKYLTDILDELLLNEYLFKKEGV